MAIENRMLEIGFKCKTHNNLCSGVVVQNKFSS